MKWEVQIRGSSRVRNNLRRFVNEFPQESGAVIYDWAQETRRELRGTPYPSYLPQFRHRRTGALANRWAVERQRGRNSTTVRIVNRANRGGFPYPVIVVANSAGERVGRSNHPSFARWWIARKKIDARGPILTRRLTALLNRMLRR